MKQNIRGFVTGFIVSVIFILLVFGLLFVSYHVQKSGSPDYAPLIETQEVHGEYVLSLMGARVHIRKESVAQATPYLQKMTVFLPPALRAFTAGWNGVAHLVTGRPLEPPFVFGPPPGYSQPSPVPGTSG